LLDGLPQLKKLVAAAGEKGMKSLALTDHGVMYGAHKFYQECKYNDIKPIIGCEVYVAPRSRKQKVAKLDEKPFHLTLLAENDEGYHNLVKLVSAGFLEGYYYKPRIDKQLLKQYSNGLIALSGCMAGELSRKISSQKYNEAQDVAHEYQNIFGKENYFMEVMRTGIPGQEKINKKIIELSESMSIPLVATCDSHYINKDDAFAQEVLMCVSTGKRIDEEHLTLETDQLYMKDEKEMKEVFKDLPNAVKNTQKISDRCSVDLDMKDWILPDPHIPKDYKNDFDKYLYDHSVERAKEKFGRDLSKEEKKRFEYEYKIIKDKGFSKYMLMVSEFTDWLHENNVPMTTRGSAAGSLLSYFLGIVNANPLDFDLQFERFLNPLRPKAPDIDLDVASSRREELIEHAIKLFGKENTAHIVTFGRMQARGSIRDAGRVLGMPLGYVDKIAKLIPPSGQGLAKVNIDKALNMVPELDQLIKQDSDAARLIDTAKRIEGVAKSQGIHACGILITPTAITDYVPVIWDESLGKNGRMITQYEMDSLEDMGLIKMDFLGLTNLDTIAETVKIVKRERDKAIDIEELPLDDKDTFDLIRNLDTEGIFQFETGPMKSTTKVLKPLDIFDLAAALALVRPGPNQNQQAYADRKHGKQKVSFVDPRMKDFLQRSNGVLVYQEDIIRTVINLAGMDWGEADKVRKATGKKKPEVLFEMKDELIERFMKHGMSKKLANEIFELFIPFTNYAFNQAHAAAYSLVSYQSAWLKTHYPVEFMAALLKSEIEDFEKVGRIIGECNRKGVSILPPDINKSMADFSIEDKTNIRFGLVGVKNIGKAVINEIIETRGQEEFKNLDDFLNRVPLDKVNQKSILYLIQVGAFDQFGERNALLTTLPSLFDRYKQKQDALKEGQMDIFAMGSDEKAQTATASPLPQVNPAPDSEKIEWERTLLGMYITAHPLGKIKPYLIYKGTLKISQIREMRANTPVSLGGLITNVKRISTKKDNRSMAFIEIEDRTGKTMEAILFPSTYEKFSEKLQENTPVIIKGKVNIRDDERSIIIETIDTIDMKLAREFSKGVFLEIDPNADKKQLSALKQALKDNPGKDPVTLFINKGNKTQTMKLKNGIKLTAEVESIIDPFRI
jgi:DNA polymerase-3 subunit alpha